MIERTIRAAKRAAYDDRTGTPATRPVEVAASGPALLVAVGCLNVDLSAQVPALPERDGRTMSAGFRRSLGGMAANVACAAAALGPPWPVQAELIAPLGHDPHAAWVESELRGRGVSTHWLDRESSRDTSLCLILVEANGDRAIVSEPTRLRYQRIGERLQAESPSVPRPRLLHADGFHAPGVLASFDRARNLGWRTSVDIDELAPEHLSSPRFREILASFDLAFINRRCARQLFPELAEAERQSRIQALAAATETLIVLTLGARGATVVEPGAGAVAVPPYRVATVDTTGAGDVFAGIFLACWLNGLGPREAAAHACAGAALSTTSRGALGCLPDAKRTMDCRA